ncbi:hypothetical protein [Algoriphagus sp. NG3]|uniref:hypothetical protein n=1 Tax=unclassified Algoriphagus TaxID=2641541 RepID=UPI002A8171AF|nr:hypothetical protein [Algoriphagus sp. NG3]WPR73643.1 hypothetical protein SLW71_13240 [Algoriphagus sp. NG3]
MIENQQNLDLELWLDQDIIPRQNRLKAKFWEILGEVANTVDAQELRRIHSSSRGAKLSRGNDLLGYPYQVLDLIRDFNVDKGMNIRLLNWFGHGVFIFVLIGKNHGSPPHRELIANHWAFDLSSSPYDYPDIILNHAFTTSFSEDTIHNSTFCQWHKSIELSNDTIATEFIISNELKKILSLLAKKIG